MMRGTLLAAFCALLPLPVLAEAAVMTDAERENWLAVGRVNQGGFKSRAACSGVLISPTVVLTAAHCVASPKTGKVYPLYRFRFVAGWHKGEHAGTSTAKSITVHPDYANHKAGSFAKIGVDLALMELSEPIESVTPAPVNLSDDVFAEGPVRMIGYRFDRPHIVTDYQGCDAYVFRKSMLSVNCDVVQGTSGAPVFGERNGVWEVVGIVSSKLSNRGRDKALAPLVGTIKALIESKEIASNP
jgi:protease YdgD